MSHKRARLGSLVGDSRSRQLGQVLPIFAIMAVVLLGGAALLTDVAWWWTSEQRMQRAADAGALAGARFLPGNPTMANTTAIAEVTKNGFAHGQKGVEVTTRVAAGNPRRLIVNVKAPVETNFAKVFCWQGGPCLRSVNVGVTGAAEMELPIPMGSLDSYYGVFGKLRTPGGGTQGPPVPGSAGPLVPTAAVSGTWIPDPSSGTVLAAVQSDDSAYAGTSTVDAKHVFGNFGLLGSIPSPAAGQTLTIRGIEVLLDDARVSAACPSSYIQVHLWDGSNFSNAPNPITLNDSPMLTMSEGDFIVGSATSTAAFPIGRAWARADFDDARFGVRLTATKGSCDPSTEIRVDQVRVRVSYAMTTFIPDANIPDPYGRPLTPRGFWGTFINQGADKINGDAYLPKWDPRTTPSLNAEYDPLAYYNYAVKVPSGASSGELWIYDPVFCATSGNGRYGTGDRWFNGSNATSAFYTLYDTRNTPYDYSDDIEVASSGSLFAGPTFLGIRASDESLGGPDLGAAGASTDCSVGATSNQSDGRYWHNRWWQMTTGLQGGRTYRLHTRSTDTPTLGHPGAPDAMNNANGHNSFALWAQASGGSPRIHGLGAMEAFTPLNPADAAEFFLAQIIAENAGKTLVIKLWDPGDTGELPASLQFLRPISTAPGYTAATFSYTAKRVASGGVNCGDGTTWVTNRTFVTTNTGNNSLFNGCWLEIEVPLPTTYDAPTPPGLTEPGWWKIRYVMGGNAADDPAFDLTTWEVTIRKNPVHLVQE